MPRTGTAWRGLWFIAFTVDDLGAKHDKHRGMTRGRALNRMIRSWR